MSQDPKTVKCPACVCELDGNDLITNNMYSSPKGIAGSALQSVPQLELTAAADE